MNNEKNIENTQGYGYNLGQNQHKNYNGQTRDSLHQDYGESKIAIETIQYVNNNIE